MPGRAILAVAMLACLAGCPASFSQELSGPEFQARLDQIVDKLAGFDYGGDMNVVHALSDLLAATQGQAGQRRELADRLAAVLQSGAPAGAKDLVCRQLAIIGTEQQVPALAALLPDERLSDMARLALERIPGPAAEQALREALDKAQGNTLVGVIHSLAQRRDQKAAARLATLLEGPDPAVAGAAATALGSIGDPASLKALGEALKKVSPRVRARVGEAILFAAERALAEGDRDGAAAAYERLRRPELPKPVRTAATRGLILARGPAGVPLLIGLLQDKDAESFGLALTLAREMPGNDVTAALAGALTKLVPERQALVVRALADRGDRAAAPAVLALIQTSDPKARAAALEALARLADASAVPALVKAAAQKESAPAQAAIATLTSLPGKDVDAAILTLAGAAEPELRRVVIELIGARRIAAGVPTLVAAAADSDESIRLAAIQALAETAGLDHLPALLDLLAGAKAPGEADAVERAIGLAVARIADRDACAQKVAGALAAAGDQSKQSLLRTLGRIGGPRALEALGAATKDPSQQARDTAVRILADWPDAAAIPILAQLARTSQDRTSRLLALRGYIRLIGQAGLPPDKRLPMCKDALSLAERDEERRLVLGVLGGIPDPEALALVLVYLSNPSTANEASAAAVSIGRQIAGTHPGAVADAMNKVIQAADSPELKKQASELRGKTGVKPPEPPR
ncbi:MAG: HEAT repeat domain-containing protein [Thermoguttaceae bacterium]